MRTLIYATLGAVIAYWSPLRTRRGRRTSLQITTGHGTMVRQNHEVGSKFTGKGNFFDRRYICDLICGSEMGGRV
jgi:hypothetical protein